MAVRNQVRNTNKLSRQMHKMLRFYAKIHHKSDSQNIFGIDFTPRYYIEPVEMIEVVQITNQARSIDRGFKKDTETGYYVKAMPETYNATDVAVDLMGIKYNTNYGYEIGNMNSWTQWWNTVTSPQKQFQYQWLYENYRDNGSDIVDDANTPSTETYVVGKMIEYEVVVVSDTSQADFNIKAKPHCSFSKTHSCP